jgi:hypothetical protein
MTIPSSKAMNLILHELPTSPLVDSQLQTIKFALQMSSSIISANSDFFDNVGLVIIIKMPVIFKTSWDI